MPLSNEEFASHINRISELSGDNEEVMNLLNDINQDHSASQYNDSDVFDNDGVRFSQKYTDLKKQYRERFFSAPAEPQQDPQPKSEENEVTFESLFK